MNYFFIFFIVIHVMMWLHYSIKSGFNIPTMMGRLIGSTIMIVAMYYMILIGF